MFIFLKVSEEYRRNPLNIYGKSKKIVEDYILKTKIKIILNVVSLEFLIQLEKNQKEVISYQIWSIK